MKNTVRPIAVSSLLLICSIPAFANTLPTPTDRYAAVLAAQNRDMEAQLKYLNARLCEMQAQNPNTKISGAEHCPR